MVAAVLALSIVVLEHHGWLNWLDTVSLRVALALKSAPGQAAETSTAGAASQPGQVHVLLLGADAFELAFKQESPLARPVLTRLLETITARAPAVVAMDIDLSPGPEGALGNAGQAALDEQLIRTARQGKTQVVLVTPFPVADEALLQTKFQWVRKLCQAGVRFAYPHIHLSQGLAMRFRKEARSLGVVAAEAARGEAVVPSADEPCTLVGQGIDRAIFLSTLADPGQHQEASDFGTMLPVDPDALERVAATAITWAGDATDRLPGLQAGEVVFVGASFDPRDAFLTLHGPQPGVMFHAASAQTLRAPPRKVGHAAAFAFDILLGVSAGYLFGWGWGRYNHAAALQAGGQGRPWPLWARARGWLLLNVVILAAWLFLLFALSALLLRAHLWASPAAMVLGVFGKTLLASRHGAFEPGHGAGAPPAHAGDALAAARVSRIGDLVLGAPLLLYGAWLAFLAH